MEPSFISHAVDKLRECFVNEYYHNASERGAVISSILSVFGWYRIYMVAIDLSVDVPYSQSPLYGAFLYDSGHLT